MKKVKINYSLLVLLFVNLTGNIHAWSNAIWPFNTPYFVSRQICKNSEGWAKNAFEFRDYSDRPTLLENLRFEYTQSLASDLKYEKWTQIYYDEMKRYIQIVWRNPDITEEMTIEIIDKECESRIKYIEKLLEASNPIK